MPLDIPRDTSIQAYHQIKDEGLLSRMRLMVYEHLFKHGPLTRSELDNQLKGPNEVNPSYHKRLSELERQGVVKTVGRKACSITGRECELWDVTSALPIPFTRDPSKKQVLLDAAKAYAQAKKRGAPREERMSLAKTLLDAATEAF